MYNTSSNPILNNVIFSGNKASFLGGGMYNTNNSQPTLINGIFSGNSTTYNGGGMSNNNSSSPILANITFSGNKAGRNGGGMYNFSGSDPSVYNSILWNNQDRGGTGTINATIYNNSSTTTLTHSLMQGSGGSNSWIGGSYGDGDNNLDADLLFATPISPTSAPTTTGDLRLLPGSPAIDSGLNSAITAATDISGNARIINSTVDMGA